MFQILVQLGLSVVISMHSIGAKLMHQGGNMYTPPASSSLAYDAGLFAHGTSSIIF